jgi:ABC-type molybdate transport system substrate-binding protein
VIKQRLRSTALAASIATLLFSSAAGAQDAPGRAHVTVYANVLLRKPFDELVQRFTKQTGIVVDATYDANGVLVDSIKTAAPDLFVALDLIAPLQLRDAKTYGEVAVVARTDMCLLARPSIGRSRSAADILTDPSVELIEQFPGAFTTAFADRVLQMLDRQRPGSGSAANARARVIGADTATASNVLLSSNAAFLTYCSFANAVLATHPAEFEAIELPASLNAQVPFDLVARNGISADAKRFNDFLLSEEAKHVFADDAYTGLANALQPGEGALTYNSYERRGNTTLYMTHYVYRYPNGRLEEDDVPWPFRYPVFNDPFVRGASEIPMQPPPPGFVPKRPLKPILLEFFLKPRITGAAHAVPRVSLSRRG